MNIRYFTIPNLLTLSNLFCGALAVTAAFEGDLRLAFLLVVLSALFDFLDGFSARLLGQYSPLGVELDSLADMVSFGLAPSAIVYSMYCVAYADAGGLPVAADAPWRQAAFIIVLFSALRLARFNIDEDQIAEFIGMPTPACAIFFSSVGYLYASGELPPFDCRWILAAAAVMAVLLVAPVRMFSLKMHGFGWRGNELRYCFVILSAAAVAVWWIKAVPCVIVAYILVSSVRHLVAKAGGSDR